LLAYLATYTSTCTSNKIILLEYISDIIDVSIDISSLPRRSSIEISLNDFIRDTPVESSSKDGIIFI